MGGAGVSQESAKRFVDPAPPSVARLEPMEAPAAKEHPGLTVHAAPKDLHVGAATVDTRTGELLGFYGGQDYLDSQINWAVSGGMAGA